MFWGPLDLKLQEYAINKLMDIFGYEAVIHTLFLIFMSLELNKYNNNYS